jgi:hypothetical protein
VSPAQGGQRRYDWYTVSVDSVKGWTIVLTLIGLVAAGFLTYDWFKQQFLEREVARVVKEAEDLYQRLQTEEGIGSFRSEYSISRNNLEEARSLAARGELDDALKSAERSRTLLSSILNALRHSGSIGEASFISVKGGVEFRRGEQGPWQPAKSRVALQEGDYVKTSGRGSTEIMTADGTVYSVKADTVILVGQGRGGSGASPERTINLEFGWVDLSTSQSPSRVTTPTAEARVRRDSSAVISYDQEQDVGRFATYRGEMEVESKDGERREVAALQQVVQTETELSQPKPLPSAPMLLEPVDNFETQLGVDERLVLTWQPVSGAQRYALQVARNRLFVDNIIDVDDRSRTKATLGLQGEGSFVWRVSALGEEGVMGPWSSPRRFRVVTLREVAAAAEAQVAGSTPGGSP